MRIRVLHVHLQTKDAACAARLYLLIFPLFFIHELFMRNRRVEGQRRGTLRSTLHFSFTGPASFSHLAQRVLQSLLVFFHRGLPKLFQMLSYASHGGSRSVLPCFGARGAFVRHADLSTSNRASTPPTLLHLPSQYHPSCRRGSSYHPILSSAAMVNDEGFGGLFSVYSFQRDRFPGSLFLQSGSLEPTVFPFEATIPAVHQARAQPPRDSLSLRSLSLPSGGWKTAWTVGNAIHDGPWPFGARRGHRRFRLHASSLPTFAAPRLRRNTEHECVRKRERDLDDIRATRKAHDTPKTAEECADRTSSFASFSSTWWVPLHRRGSRSCWIGCCFGSMPRRVEGGSSGSKVAGWRTSTHGVPAQTEAG